MFACDPDFILCMCIITLTYFYFGGNSKEHNDHRNMLFSAQ